jgi:hypothetical protein
MITFQEKPIEFSELKWRIIKYFVKSYSYYRGYFDGFKFVIKDEHYIGNRTLCFKYSMWTHKIGDDKATCYTIMNLFYNTFFKKRLIQ